MYVALKKKLAFSSKALLACLDDIKACMAFIVFWLQQKKVFGPSGYGNTILAAACVMR